MRFAVTFRHASVSVRAELTFALQDASGTIFLNPANTAQQIWDNAVPNLVSAASASVVFTGVVVEDVRTVPYGGAEFPQTPQAGTFTSAGIALPTDCCIAIKRSTALLGRSGRGRLYWPIWQSPELDTADTIPSSHATFIVGKVQDFDNAIVAALPTANLVLISTVTGGAPRTNGLPESITGYSVADLAIDSQRRRLLGRGP